jgi:hypothetical protein
MKAKELTQADIGKWVTLRAEIAYVRDDYIDLKLEGELGSDNNQTTTTIYPSAILEFTDPPETPIGVGDVYKFSTSRKEWTLVALVGDICLFTTEDKSHVSVALPLNKIDWTFVRKGAQS